SGPASDIRGGDGDVMARIQVQVARHQVGNVVAPYGELRPEGEVGLPQRISRAAAKVVTVEVDDVHVLVAVEVGDEELTARTAKAADRRGQRESATAAVLVEVNRVVAARRAAEVPLQDGRVAPCSVA